MVSKLKVSIRLYCGKFHLLMLSIFLMSSFLFIKKIRELNEKSTWEYMLRESSGVTILQYGKQRLVKPVEENGRVVEIWDLDLENIQNEMTEEFDGLILAPEVYGNYCAYDNVLQEALPKEKLITMILHTSFSYLDEGFIKMGMAWDGSISLAIFIDKFSSNSDMIFVVNWITQLRAKISQEKSLFVHVFFERIDYDECPMFFIESKFLNGTNNTTISRNPIDSSTYPINVARNLARRFAPPHDYFLVADMDQEYSNDAEKKLRLIANQRNLTFSKEVLVIRRFEHENNSSSPKTISELQTRYNEDVFFFHQKYFSPAHAIPNLTEWFQRGDHSTKTTPVKYRSHYWEPMFVAASNIPYHDETLRYQHMNHLALCWDLCVDGYKFMVVDGVFNTHSGVKELKKIGYYQWPSKKAEKLAKEAAKAHRERLKRDHPREFQQCLGQKKRSKQPTKASTLDQMN